MKGKLHYWIVYSILLCWLTQSCDTAEIQCGENGGEPVNCHDANGNFIGTYCSDRDFPSCDCYSGLGIEGTNLIDKFSNRDECTDEGQYNYDGLPADNSDVVGSAKTLDKPYTFQCTSLGVDDVCTEYDTYYYDTGEDSYDQRYRPIYVQASIALFDLEKYDYKVYLLEPLTGQKVFFNIDAGTLDNPRVQYFNQTDCGTDICPATINIKMDASLFQRLVDSYDKRFEVYLDQIEKASQISINLARDSFTIPADHERSTRRDFYLKVFKTASHDITSYIMGNRGFSRSVADVFEERSANIRMHIPSSSSLPIQYIQGDNMVLNSQYFSPINESISIEELSDAMREWSFETTTKLLIKDKRVDIFNEDFGLSIAISEFDVVNPVNGEKDVSLSDKVNRVLTREGKIFGVTLNPSKYEFVYYNSSILFNKVASEYLEGDGGGDIGDRVTHDEFQLSTFLHELGHMWSESGSSSAYMNKTLTDCQQHTGHCNGKNYYQCLWRFSCIRSSNDPNDLSAPEYKLNTVLNPTFCEGHYQLFMNSLKPRK